ENGTPDAARAQQTQALKEARRANDARQIGAAYSLLGYLNYRSGDYLAAIEAYRQSLPFTRQGGDLLQESYSISSLGLCLSYVGHAAEPLPLLERTRDLRRDLALHEFDGISLHNIALALSELGRQADAEAMFAQALDVHRQRHDLGEEAVTTLA